MTKPLIEKLSRYLVLSEEEKQILESTNRKSLTIEKGDDFIVKGQNPTYVHLIESGWACRYKVQKDGNNQIMAHLIPGDMGDVLVTILDKMDHSIRALSTLKVTQFSANEIKDLMDNYPRIGRAIFWSVLVDEAILRQWLVNMGTLSSELRVAHQICELLVRSRIAGLSHDNSFDCPLTQIELGESLGISQVHTNRVLQKLREKGLFSKVNNQITIPDWQRMKAYAEFDPSYLHVKMNAV